MGSYEPVRSVQRAMQVLTVLNAQGAMTLAAIAVATGLSKPTILRLLETLCGEDMVERDTLNREYRVNFGVQRHSWGFVETDVLARAGEQLDAITKEHLWPCALGVPSRHMIRTRYSTHRFSPLHWWNPDVGTQLPLLHYAMGMAYLGFCTPDAQRSHLDLIGEANERAGRPAIDIAHESERLRHVRAAGYAFRPHSKANRTCSIAVPLLVDGRPVGSLAMTYFARAHTREDAEQRYLPALLDAAGRASGGS